MLDICRETGIDSPGGMVVVMVVAISGREEEGRLYMLEIVTVCWSGNNTGLVRVPVYADTILRIREILVGICICDT